MQITPISFGRKNEIVIANILLDQDWKTTVGGEEFVFPPLAQFRVSKEDGHYLLEKAITAHTDRIEQAHGERNMWARKISSLNQRERDQALRFCDVNGNTITKPWPHCPLVNLSTSDGMAAYQRAAEEARLRGIHLENAKPASKAIDLPTNAGLPDPDAGNIMQSESRESERQTYETNEVVPPRANPPVTTAANVEPQSPQEGGRLPVKIGKPKDEWSEADLVKYAQQNGFTVSKMDLKIPGKALEIATRAHVDHCKRLTAAGVEFVEV